MFQCERDYTTLLGNVLVVRGRSHCCVILVSTGAQQLGMLVLIQINCPMVFKAQKETVRASKSTGTNKQGGGADYGETFFFWISS